MKRFLPVVLLGAIACTAAFAKSGTFAAFAAANPRLERSYLPYTTEQEKLVSEIAGSILNIAAFASHFDPADRFQVRNIANAGDVPRFSVARRGEVFRVEPRQHVWTPASYAALARSYMADGAGPTVSGDQATDTVELGVVMDPDADSLARQDARLSRLLHRHPRSAAIHQRAALLIGAALRADAAADPRPLLCRMTAHLAVARALQPGAPGGEGEMAERMLTELAASESGTSRSPLSGGAQWADGTILR